MLSRLLSIIYITILSSRFVLSVGTTNTVPVIMYSYLLSPGLIKYQRNYNHKQTVPAESFKIIAEELLGNCNSDAYIFINIPGLNEFDFVEYRDDLKYLEKSFELSSTGLKFEKIELDRSVFDHLIDFTEQECQVEKILKLTGNDTAQFEPYLDTDKRIIEIDFPALDSMDDQTRSETIDHFDNYLKIVLSQIPSPHQSLILTSLEPSSQIHKSSSSLEQYDGFFNDIVERKQDVEKNNRLLDIPIIRHKYRPLRQELHSDYVSIFDNDFIQKNYTLLKLIATTTIIFIMYQLIFSQSIFSNKQGKQQNTTTTTSKLKDGKKGDVPDKMNKDKQKIRETNDKNEKSKKE